jgi:hypothetical protein
MWSGVFVVEDIESCQADVRDFFLTENNYRCGVLRRCIGCQTNGCPGCAARQRQRPSDSQYRCGFHPTPSLRSLPRVRHGGDLPYKLGWVWRPSHIRLPCAPSRRGLWALRGPGPRLGRDAENFPAGLFRQLSGIAAVPYGFRNSSDSQAIFVRAPRRA